MFTFDRSLAIAIMVSNLYYTTVLLLINWDQTPLSWIW
jgi:hypothetical protein